MSEDQVEFELEETIQSYLLFLLSMEEKDFIKVVPKR